MGPGMEAGTPSGAECPTLKAHMGGDTLEAFTPLAQYTQRVHGDHMQNAGKMIVGIITSASGIVQQRIRVREEDLVPESAGLMKVKQEDDPLKRREQFTNDLRKSKKQQLLSLKRGLYGNMSPRNRSPSPMFTGLKVRTFPA